MREPQKARYIRENMSTELTGGTFYIYSFKDGLLSRLGHDLRFSAPRFRVTLDETDGNVEATVRADHLILDGNMQDGRLHTNDLSSADQKEILKNLAKILNSAAHPDVTFRGTYRPTDAAMANRFTVAGALTLNGRSAPLSFSAVRTPDNQFTGTFDLTPTNWAIAPFRALLGALKLQDRVRIEFNLF